MMEVVLLAIATAVLLLAQVPGPPGVPAADVARLVISAPDTIQTLDAKILGGVPTRLAWSPDGRQLYVRASRFDRWSNETATHVVVSLDTGEVSAGATEPFWAMRYWSWKSAPIAPGRDDFAIKIETREEIVRTTNVPREGSIGMSTADPTAGLDEVVRNAAISSQKTFFENLTVRGHIIDRAVNRHTVPGRTFGWAPVPRALLAYADEKGRLVLMDGQGRTRQVKRTKDVSLPAWSEDGTRIAFVQKAGRDSSAVRVIEIR
jgi:dipeptidyl aminopeptidase/acylaminoacyl peptidase